MVRTRTSTLDGNLSSLSEELVLAGADGIKQVESQLDARGFRLFDSQI